MCFSFPRHSSIQNINPGTWKVVRNVTFLAVSVSFDVKSSKHVAEYFGFYFWEMEATVNLCFCLEYGVSMQAKGIAHHCRRIIIF